MANDDINVKTEKGRLSANILITIIKKLSSLSKLFTINSAEQNKIIEIIMLDRNPSFKDE